MISDRGADSEESLSARLGSWMLRVSSLLRRKPSPRTERLILVLAFVVFVAAAVLAVRNFPGDPQRIRWGVLISAGMIGMPLNLVLNAVEFRIIGRFTGERIPFGRAVVVTLVGSAANLLPIPGSTLVRVQALAQRGVTYRQALTASVVIGVMSVGANLGLAGLAQFGSASALVVVGLVVAAGCLIFAVFGVIASTFAGPGSKRLGSRALGVEALYATVASVRLWLILLGLGVDVGLPTAFALTATGSIAAAVGFFPSGLGIREAIMGAVSPLVGIPIAVGLMGAVVERIFWFVVLAGAAGMLVARKGMDALRSPDGVVRAQSEAEA